MPKTTTFQRASTMDLQPSIRRMGRPLRSAPLVSQRTESAHSRSSIRRWMLTNMEDYRDRRTGELNLTDMVEAWDRACADGGATLDPDHIAWDVAASLE